ncbi:helix-turn-helix domain-containing protein [Halomonas sp. 25-S5]|uniref:helix-turn-helix domain-containing protein n=1 Tax=Halomonas sp. 25-S5 TaxID=2994065 RepID=UPI002468F443|nr:helix-turn-helix domain-containing protein [Halomonas sp. 25-S5]
MMELPEQVTVPQAADILGISTRTLYRWLRQGRLTAGTGPDGRRAMCRDDVIAMAVTRQRPVTGHDAPIVTASWQEIRRLSEGLEGLQRRLDRQAELLEALIRLSPADSIEALIRKREMLEALGKGADNRPGFR